MRRQLADKPKQTLEESFAEGFKQYPFVLTSFITVKKVWLGVVNILRYCFFVLLKNSIRRIAYLFLLGFIVSSAVIAMAFCGWLNLDIDESFSVIFIWLVTNAGTLCFMLLALCLHVLGKMDLGEIERFFFFMVSTFLIILNLLILFLFVEFTNSPSFSF